ncbi:MAG: 4'-phosphopantetheinyl transferase family protein [Terrimicrobiaceae bacterium]
MSRFEIPAPGEFHIYHVISEGDEKILSDFEKNRYAEFKNQDAALIYLKGHCAARNLAASYTRKNPSELEFHTAPEGKPFFRCLPNLHFNLSHSGDDIFIAFSCDPVGFDIEKRSRKADFQKLSTRYFQPGEIQLMNASSKPESLAFLELWTAKEAMLKLLGTGIASGLDKSLVFNEEEGIFAETKIHFRRYFSGDLIGTLASFSKIRQLHEFTY